MLAPVLAASAETGGKRCHSEMINKTSSPTPGYLPPSPQAPSPQAAGIPIADPRGGGDTTADPLGAAHPPKAADPSTAGHCRDATSSPSLGGGSEPREGVMEVKRGSRSSADEVTPGGGVPSVTPMGPLRERSPPPPGPSSSGEAGKGSLGAEGDWGDLLQGELGTPYVHIACLLGVMNLHENSCRWLPPLPGCIFPCSAVGKRRGEGCCPICD